jgi:hypothetical protein
MWLSVIRSLAFSNPSRGEQPLGIVQAVVPIVTKKAVKSNEQQ